MSLEERMKILEMLDKGIITADQATALLASVDEDSEMDDADFEDEFEESPIDEIPDETLTYEVLIDEPPTPATAALEAEPAMAGTAAPETPTPPAPPLAQIPLEPAAQARTPAKSQPDLNRWRRWWVFPLAVGAGITMFSGWLLYVGNANTWAGFWMACLWIPLLLGILVTTLAWISHNTPWLHVRVHTGQDEWPRRIAISFPLPVRLTAWGLRIFGKYIPNMEGIDLDEILLALGKTLTTEDPIYIEVDNGKGQEYVEVFIG